MLWFQRHGWAVSQLLSHCQNIYHVPLVHHTPVCFTQHDSFELTVAALRPEAEHTGTGGRCVWRAGKDVRQMRGMKGAVDCAAASCVTSKPSSYYLSFSMSAAHSHPRCTPTRHPSRWCGRLHTRGLLTPGFRESFACSVCEPHAAAWSFTQIMLSPHLSSRVTEWVLEMCCSYLSAEARVHVAGEAVVGILLSWV